MHIENFTAKFIQSHSSSSRGMASFKTKGSQSLRSRVITKYFMLSVAGTRTTDSVHTDKSIKTMISLC